METPRAPEAWLGAVETRGTGESGRVPLSGAEQAAEMLMMGLRLGEGVSLGRFERLNGGPLEAGALWELEQLGLVRVAGDRLFATGRGRLVLDGVLGRLLG